MQEKKSLLNGNLLTCPRCHNEASVESYMRLVEAESYKHETSPIYKCEKCKWIFALAIPENFQKKLMELLSSTGSIPISEADSK